MCSSMVDEDGDDDDDRQQSGSVSDDHCTYQLCHREQSCASGNIRRQRIVLCQRGRVDSNRMSIAIVIVVMARGTVDRGWRQLRRR